MALDGIYLSLIKKEINNRLESSKIDKIQQPEKDEIDLTFRMRNGTEKLLISSSANYPRIHMTERSKENPMTAPMFCMLLRKHLTGAKFREVRQPGLERILFLDFDCYDEFGDETVKTLAVEIMGRHSNIILLDESGKIMDSIKRIDETMSSKRQVLPGLPYDLPPAQDKLDFTAVPAENVLKESGLQKDMDLSKWLLSRLQGISPVICRELSQLACRTTDARTGSLTSGQKERLAFFMGKIASSVKDGTVRPVMVSDGKTGRPIDFAFMDVTQYGVAAATRAFDSFSALLDTFYYEKDRAERFSQRAQDILKVITNVVERTSRKLESQNAELARCGDREQLKICGDLLSSNLHLLKKGDSVCELANYYEEGSPLFRIKLDPMLTPAMNAQKYYREYRKAATAEKYLREQIANDRTELEYLDTVFDELSRASGETELAEIREELANGGYLKNRKSVKLRAQRESKPLRFRSTDGFDIMVGRNNRQNDRLTLKMADRNDLWFHTRNIPGSHVIVCCGGRDVPDRTLEQAAMLAAFHSKAKDSRQVPVDYTMARHVKKPSGAKPGMVIYDHFRTLYVNPDGALSDRLKI